MSILDILIFVLTLVVLVVSHEFGHFFAAKKFGVKVLEFGFGLPPKVWGKVKDGTEYTINLLPIGGFVRLYGEDEVDKKALEAKDSFASQPVWERIGIVVAGVIMNLLVAVFIFYIILFSQGFTDKIPLIIPHQFSGANQTNESSVLVNEVSPNSPADQAGIKTLDRILEVNGQKITTNSDVINITKANAGKPVEYTLLDISNYSRKITATPRINPPAGEGALGIGLESVDMAVLTYQTPIQKLLGGFYEAYNWTAYELDTFGFIINTAIADKSIGLVCATVSGPVGMTKVAGTILNTGAPSLPYLNLMALISLSLAVFNILPIPALDGGRLFFLLIEAIFKKKINPVWERNIMTGGMIFLIGLIILVTAKDIFPIC